MPKKWEEYTLHINKGKDLIEQTKYYNVVDKRTSHTSELATSKLTKNQKNRTLISRQPLNNKF